MFADTLQDHGSSPALIDEHGGVLTYAELAARADALAARIGPERRLLLVEATNQVETVIAYIAALRGGHPVILTSGPASREIHDVFAPTILHGEGHIHAMTPPAGGMAADLAVMLSTSGTTGSAKLVRLSRDNIEANARSIVSYLGIAADDRAITTLPMGYSYGLSVLNSHLAAGAAVILTDRSVIDQSFWTLFDEQAATTMAGVPYTYELLETAGFREHSHPSLRTMTQAGGRLPAERVAAFATWAQTNGKRFFAMYGQTEATARMAYLPPEIAAQHPDCIGQAIPGGKLRIDPASRELIYAGPNVMMGYATKVEDLALPAGPAELRTGDLAEEVAPGLFRVTGRAARFSKIAGLRIGLDDIEKILAEAGCAALVAGDDTLIAVGVISPSKVEDAATVLRDRGTIPEWSLAIFPLEAAPRLSSGKPDYRAVLAAGREAHEAQADAQLDEGFARIFERIMMRAGVSGEDSFSSLAGDSLSYIQVSMAIESRLGELPGHWEQLTVGQLDGMAAAARHAPRRRMAITSLPSEVLVRLGAISAVLIHHIGSNLHGRSVQGGALVLMMVAGLNLNGFQRDHLLGEKRWSLIKLFALRLLIPFYLMVTVYRFLGTKVQVSWPTYLMVGNFYAEARGPLQGLWFLEAMFQCLLGMVLLFSIPAVRRLATKDRWLFALGLFFVAVGLKYGFHQITELQPVPGLMRRPDAHFATYIVGWLAAESTTLRRRLITFALVVGLVVADWGINDSHTAELTAAALLILFVPRIPLWRPLATGLGFIAGTTFYIYLIHPAIIHVLYYVLHFTSRPFAFTASVAGGVAFYAVWTQVMRIAVQLWHHRVAPMLASRRPAATPQAAVAPGVGAGSDR